MTRKQKNREIAYEKANCTYIPSWSNTFKVSHSVSMKGMDEESALKKF